MVVDQLPRLGKRKLVCLLLFNCNYVVSVWRGFLFLWVLGMGYVILLWHSLSLPYNYFKETNIKIYWCVKADVDLRFASVNITFHTPINLDIGLFKHQ